MRNPKFVIIVSQYWHEGHIFMCKYDDNFINTAKRMVEQLEDYKREEINKKDYYYGDLNYFDSDNIMNRYNLNDSGDIYFIMVWSVKDLAIKYHKQLEEVKEYYSGRVSKNIMNQCREHHSYEVIEKIIKSNFKIVE